MIFNKFRQPYLNAETDTSGGSTEGATTIAEGTPQPTDAKLKIKYNHEEKEISLDEARELAQKGLNYEKAVSKTAKESVDSFIANRNIVDFDGKPIKTLEHYEAYEAEIAKRNEYQSKGVPDEAIDEILQKEKMQEQTKRDQIAFLEYFEKENGRNFDSNKDTIPQEVWDEVQNGASLKKAYANYVKEQRIAEKEDKIKKLEEELEAIKKGEKAKQANAENAKTATGSVVGNGGNTELFFTAEQVRAMSKSEVKTNFRAIEESMKKWK